MLTVPQAARIAGRNPETIRRWIRDGKLPFTRVGTQYFVNEDNLVGAGRAHRVREDVAPYVISRGQQGNTGVDPWLTTIVGRIVREFDPARIILYGARAGGAVRPDGDYDILVVLEDVPDRRTARLAIRRALDDLPISKEVLVASVHDLEGQGLATWGPIGWAVREGLALYERSSGEL